MRTVYILRTDNRPTARPRILENFERPYLGNGSSDPPHVWSYRVGFSRSADRMAQLRRASCIILNGYIFKTVHPILFVFGSSYIGEDNARRVIR